ncbi:glutathione S-transferase family protein [Sphingomonas sp. ID1715]|uniref:glutathione S-transferase family protein n=1 Tax=Sphingomonas sp. ID1715 TaxID=1656898 RepID=UPI001487BB86|nr:glutathione S-transferase family protein [Sphingomonas sp. ID1715]NNM76011.1 glutathione S-transferase family protein [Sphingomonas sp. ID1715]
MKLYMRPIAPNAVKVFVFAAERGVTLDTVDVGTLSEAEYRRINPLLQIPVLETDDGLLIAESLTICRYLDEVTPGTSLFGATPQERATVSMWERRAERMLMDPAIEYGHHCQPMFIGALTQFPEWARDNLRHAHKLLPVMEQQLADNRFLAGDDFTMADITAFLGYAGLVAWGAIEAIASSNLRRWSSEVSARPSMEPFHMLQRQFGLRSL